MYIKQQQKKKKNKSKKWIGTVWTSDFELLMNYTLPPVWFCISKQENKLTENKNINEMKIINYLLSILLMCFINSFPAAAEKFPADSLPEEFQSYHLTERLNYTGKELYDYLNEGAELYLSYGLASMTGCKYNGENLPPITVEIYEMTSSENAYGVYTQSRNKEEYDYGQGSQRFLDFILFWKDRYFVMIKTQEVVPKSEKAIKHLAELINRLIPNWGKTPAIINDLPKENLVTAGFMYFHHYIWLNTYYFIADHNILRIDEHTDAVLAKYGDAGDRLYLLLVEYPDEEKATEACNRFGKKYAPELDPLDPFVLLEDETWFSVWKNGRKLGAIFNGNTREKTEELYKSITKN
jgi:hypothetical protein